MSVRPLKENDRDIEEMAERQKQYLREAKEQPDRVIPAMFFEDCTNCEERAVHRRDEGFYNHFYTTTPSSENAVYERDELPSYMCSAMEYHGDVAQATLTKPDTSTSTAEQLWDKVGDGEFVSAKLPLLHYIERQDCYIHAEPFRVGMIYGYPLYVYKRRKSDNWYDQFVDWDHTYLWVAGWILHAEGFYNPDHRLWLAMLKHAGKPEVSPDFLAEVEDQLLQGLLPDSLADEKYDPEDRLSYALNASEYIHGRIFPYSREYFIDQFVCWRELYFGEREPQGCGQCSDCT